MSISPYPRWSSRRRSVALGVTATLAVTVVSAGPARADISTPIAACTPTVLPSPDGNGEVMWITSSQLYVGSAGTAGTDPWGNPAYAAAYWTHSSSGYQLQRLPNDPMVDDEVLDANTHGTMIDFGADPVTGDGVSYVYDLASNTWSPLAGNGGHFTRGRRINAEGVVAGGSDDSHGVTYATTWAPPYNRPNRLPAGGAPQKFQYNGQTYSIGSYALGINNAGVTVGTSGMAGHFPNIQAIAREVHPLHGALLPYLTPTRWSPTSAPSKLPAPYEQGEAWSINDTGLIVGDTYTADFSALPAYWSGGSWHSMGAGTDVVYGAPRGLSSGGWATGELDFADGTVKPLIWTGAGALQQLMPPGGPLGLTNANTHAVSDLYRQVGGDSWNDARTADQPTVWQCPAGFTTA